MVILQLNSLLSNIADFTNSFEDLLKLDQNKSMYILLLNWIP